MKHAAWTEWLLLLTIFLGGSVGFPSSIEAQSKGKLDGRVLALRTRSPLANCTVEILGTGRFVRTDSAGRFDLGEVPSGTIILRTIHEGFAAAIEQIEIREGARSRIDFYLEEVALILEEMLVRRETSARPDLVTAGDRSSSVEAILKAIPNVSVFRNGEVGEEPRILIRGNGSLSLSGDPAIYIDGVRVPASRSHLGGPLMQGILDMVPLEAIDSIRVLRGASAGARFGPATSNGVILIFTKRGGK